MDKRILFVVFLSIGNTILVSVSYYFLGIENAFQSVAVFTSLSTAVYTILTEPKKRTEPILRVIPFLRSGLGLGSISLSVHIKNIGYSIARNIEVRCKIIPDSTIPLEKNGIFKIQLLAPDEPFEVRPVPDIVSQQLLSQQKFNVEVLYTNEEDKKQKPIKIEVSMSDLEYDLRSRKTS